MSILSPLTSDSSNVVLRENHLVKFLNLGCGSTYSTDPVWTNVDIGTYSPHIYNYDIKKNLPFANADFDACYSSHLIEHLTQHEAKKLLAECWRVLKAQGIIRVVVPDLESIAKAYLSTLEQVDSGSVEVEPNYEWMMLELYDQTVRSFSGGGMGRFLASPNLSNKDFILSRIGAEVENYWRKKSEKKSFWDRIRHKKPYWYIQQFQNLRNILAKYLVVAVAGKEAKKAFEEGLFRNSGEIHKWMYDRFSLRQLLEREGFVDVRVCRAEESRIPNFNSYHLDVVEGKVRKPDSLFVEGIKP